MLAARRFLVVLLALAACADEPMATPDAGVTLDAAAPAAFCGDRACDPGESCTSCPIDCGDCCAAQGTACHSGARCVESAGTWRCDCTAGYRTESGGCVDIDECLSPDSCDPNAVCRNVAGSFVCGCDRGYVGDGFECTDVDECEMSGRCGPGSDCVNTEGAYECVCRDGYETLPTGCVDIDECAQGIAQCDPEQVCGNFPGGFVCADRGWRSVHLGDRRTCGIRRDGSVWCWADSPTSGVDVGGPRALAGGEWLDVSHGLNAGVAVRSDGSLWAFGKTHYALRTSGSLDLHRFDDANDWQSVRLGHRHACGIKIDGTLWCWGLNGAWIGVGDGPPTGPPVVPKRVGASTNWCQVTAGDGQSCAIDCDGHPWCWGDNDLGQLGVDTASVARSDVPIAVLDGERFRSVDAGIVVFGGTYACGIDRNDRAVCWGGNEQGQLGSPRFEGGTHTPVVVQPGQRWSKISPATGPVAAHTCAIRDDSTLWCWGANQLGQLGTGALENFVYEPAQVGLDADWRDVDVGGRHTCGVRIDGTLLCWGDDYWGQLGSGQVAIEPLPKRVGGDWRTVESHIGHSCAIDATGRLACWGRNECGQLGTGDDVQRQVPTMVTSTVSWDAVSTGAIHTCGLAADGSMWCWGCNGEGQLGLPAVETSSVPARVAGPARWTVVAAGLAHVCGVTEGGRMWCWGKNDRGQLGTGDLVDHDAPVMVRGTDRWIDVAVAARGTYAVRSDGTLWGWGDVSAYFDDPAVPDDRRSWTSIDAGPSAVCGLRNNGQVHCWGRVYSFGTAYLLGNEPTRYGVGEGWRSLGVGVDHVCAVDGTGVLQCLGDNTRGRRGRMQQAFITSFAPIDAPPGWRAAAAGELHSCGVRDDGELWCWGDNDNGRLGTGDAWRRRPIQVVDW